METLRKVVEWLKSLTPVWLRAVVLALVAVLIFIFSLSGCGITTARVRTMDSGQASITITTNNPTEVTASPNVSVDLPSSNTFNND